MRWSISTLHSPIRAYGGGGCNGSYCLMHVSCYKFCCVQNGIDHFLTCYDICYIIKSLIDFVHQVIQIHCFEYTVLNSIDKLTTEYFGNTMNFIVQFNSYFTFVRFISFPWLNFFLLELHCKILYI